MFEIKRALTPDQAASQLRLLFQAEAETSKGLAQFAGRSDPEAREMELEILKKKDKIWGQIHGLIDQARGQSIDLNLKELLPSDE